MGRAGDPLHKQIPDQKYNWNDETVNRVDWGAIPTEKMRTGKRIFVTSFCHQWMPLHQKLHQRKRIGSPLCPVCDADEEDHTHFLTCPHYKGPDTKGIIRKIKHDMTKDGVDPVLQQLIKRGLRASVGEKQDIKITDVPEEYHPLVADQQPIGWSHMWHARWSRRWEDYQAGYETNQNKTRTNR